MLYQRKFVLQTCHLNNQVAYNYLWQAIEDAKRGHYESAYDAIMTRVMPHTHGHNFVATIEISGEGLPRGKDYLFDDKDIEPCVREWDNTNVSIHPDFLKLRHRATTERMAEKLRAKIIALVPSDFHVKVSVEERNEIKATVG